MIDKHRLTFLTLLGTGIAIFGCVLLMIAFYATPVGDIANSVLIAVGELFTFSGSVLGISVTYKSNLVKLKEEIKKEYENERSN